jgi:hypothetical protein
MKIKEILEKLKLKLKCDNTVVNFFADMYHVKIIHATCSEYYMFSEDKLIQFLCIKYPRELRSYKINCMLEEIIE